ncbi:hypothetical protein Patl1_30448 [Pistacia atlantica]|uniref:Uncharacterized protein n=1 Tax=Pistacia atlantica TaxID=434234 RepID=A0ACC1ACV3_9ROSI|nr:hypothetical protein Patl1_30448 [Pistacia atlantica]
MELIYLAAALNNARLIVSHVSRSAIATDRELFAKTPNSSVEMESPSTSMAKKTETFAWSLIPTYTSMHTSLVAKTSIWDNSVDRLSLAFNGESIFLPDGEGNQWQSTESPSVTITSFKFYALSGDVNGVLGQTYASNYVSRAKMGVDMPVLGGEKEFALSSLFSTDCAAPRFVGEFALTNSPQTYFEYANLNCSRIDSRGVICKR